MLQPFAKARLGQTAWSTAGVPWLTGTHLLRLPPEHPGGKPDGKWSRTVGVGVPPGHPVLFVSEW